MFRAQTFRKTHRRGAEHTEMRIIYVLLINLFPNSVSSASLMKIPISAKIPRSYGPPPLQRGLLGDFSGVGPDHCGSFSCAVLYRLVNELLLVSEFSEVLSLRYAALCSPSCFWWRMRRRTIQLSAPKTAYKKANTGAVVRSHRCVRSGIGVFGRPVM